MKCVVCDREMMKVEGVLCADEAIRVFPKPHTISYHKTMLYRCPACTHMQIENAVSSSLYEKDYGVDYAAWASVEKKDREYLRKMQKYLEKNTENKDNCVLEIGCGEGRTLELAKDYFSEVWGIEPAQKQAELAKDRMRAVQGDVINDFFSGDYVFDRRFDAVYSKMVFEHLENPMVIGKKLYSILLPGGVGWINVPNGQKIFHENLFYLFSSVHIQYYTPLSLTLMLSKAGFEILSVDTHDDSREELVEMDILFRKPYGMGGHFSEQKEKLKKKLEREITDEDIVTIWGAGTKAHKYVQLADKIPVCHIVDKSAEKAGCFISSLSVPIEMVTKEIVQESTVIIIFASMFNKEIMEELKTMGYTGKVLYFERGELYSSNLN